MKSIIAAAACALLMSSAAQAFEFTISLGEEASMRLVVAEQGLAIGIGQIELAGKTASEFNKVTAPLLDIPYFPIPIPNPLAIVRPAFTERAKEGEVK